SAYIMAPHINCTATSTYSSIWIALLQDVALRADRYEIPLPRSVEKLVHDFENGLRIDFTPDLARKLVCDLSESAMLVVLILDEFDTIGFQETRQAVAETVKL